MIQMQADVVPVGPDTTRLPNFHRHGTARQTPRVQILGCGSVASHEGFALAVARDASFSLAALRVEITRLRELHKFQIWAWQCLTSCAPHPSPVQVRADVHDK